MPNFEPFQGRRIPVRTTRPEVTHQGKRGTFTLNGPAFEALGKPSAVELLYDRDERIIGMRRVDPKMPNAYPVRKQTAGETYLVAGQAFSKFYGLNLDGASRRYPAQMYDDILGLDLKGEFIEFPGVRKAADTRDSTATLAGTAH